MKVNIDIKARDIDFSLYAELTYLEQTSSTLRQPIFFMFMTIIALLLIIEGSNKLEDIEDYYFLSSLSYISLLMVTVIHFQYVGAFVLFMIITDTPYVLFFIFASIVTTFSTIFAYKICFIAFLYNYMNHPLIDAISLRSPRVIFTIASLVCMVFFYTSSIFLVGFHSYSYYLAFLHSFPAMHVYNAVRKGTRNTFSKYLQLFIWWPTSLFALMLRGYGGNMLNLEPSYLMSSYILIQLIGCTFISYY